VHFHEDGVAAGGDGGARERCDEAAIAARLRPLAARLLHAVGRVVDDRAAGLGEQRQRAHIGDEVVVAEREAALGHEQVRVAGRASLLDDTLHLEGRQELALLQVDRLPRRCDGENEVRLPAEERRRLQHVGYRGDGRDLRDVVHVGQHG
jgi:hypothetical protein